jgi:hypothetical protein
MLPITIADIDRLIRDGVQEDLHLDYKESPAIDRSKRNEMAKDVSAFANSDGGILIYGVIESNNLPVSKDSGVDHTVYSREWLEQVISSNITPKIDNIRIVSIPVSSSNSIYCVEVQKSDRAPHQAPDKKYYKRFNFQSVPMEDYEINDVRSRQQIVVPLMNFDVEIEHGVVVSMVVSNIGSLPAFDVTFSFSKKLGWMNRTEDPPLFRRGSKYFPPGKVHRYLYSTYADVFKPNSPFPPDFDVTVSYLHPQHGTRVSDTFHIDLNDYNEATVVEPELYEHGQMIKKAVGELVGEVKKLRASIESLEAIAGATGLDISVTTLKNLSHIARGEERIEKINPYGQNYGVFMEVLGVDYVLALHLMTYFRRIEEGKTLQQVDGITPEIIERIKLHFEVEV